MHLRVYFFSSIIHFLLHILITRKYAIFKIHPPPKCSLVSQTIHVLHTQSLSCIWFFATPGTLACQSPPSMGFPKQAYWSGLSFPSPGNLPNPEIKSTSPAWQTNSYLDPKLITLMWEELILASLKWKRNKWQGYTQGFYPISSPLNWEFL